MNDGWKEVILDVPLHINERDDSGAYGSMGHYLLRSGSRSSSLGNNTWRTTLDSGESATYRFMDSHNLVLIAYTGRPGDTPKETLKKILDYERNLF